MELSIIIPLYNAEYYIQECLDSIVHSSLTDYEIIVVNDGSTDSSVKVLTPYLSKFPSIRLINQKNSGVSIARNKGLQEARGKYVTFIDADDYINGDELKSIMTFAQFQNTDFIVTGHQRVCNNEIIGTEVLGNQRFNGDEIKRYFEKGWVGIFQPVWGKLYSREIIQLNNVKFRGGVKMYEDSIFNFEYMVHIKNMQLLSKVFYSYRKNQGSVTTQFKGMGAVKDISQNYKTQVAFFGNELTENILHRLNDHYSYSLISQIYTIYRDPKLTGKKEWLKKYVEFGNETLPNWLTYLDKGIPKHVGKLLIKKRYLLASSLLSMIFRFERFK